MHRKLSALALLVAALALGVVLLRPTPAGQEAVHPVKESAYERVMRTGVIRCGYATWTPALYKDMATGAMTGIMPDLMAEVGKRLNLRIDWAEETGWGSIVEGLATNRYDMICTGLAASSARAKVIAFNEPIFYSSVFAIARKDDPRFDANLDGLNDPQYKIAVLDGEMSSVIASQIFPLAKQVAMPQTADYSLLTKEVETGKADVTLFETVAFRTYDKANPGILKMTGGGHPIAVFPVGTATPREDASMKNMIDVTMRELVNDGTVERVLRKYEEFPGAYLRPGKTYEPVP